jgi:hypothetical protein
MRCRAIFYDESVYPEPYNYDPERYLKEGKLDTSIRDPEERVFGSSRRCGAESCHGPPPP